ncbi:MAG: DUF559 domain-containing protein [bacterium]
MNFFKYIPTIRKNYENWKPLCCPYSIFDWNLVFTEIESNVWSDIRYWGLPFYPQFPVRKYFIDFADPIWKIGIEVDGKYHKKREQGRKDLKKDEYLRNKGWFIFRISGRWTYGGTPLWRKYIQITQECSIVE